MFILQLIISVVIFANKVLVLQKKNIGWLLGAFATALAIVYFFLLHLYVFTVLEIGLTVLMAY